MTDFELYKLAYKAAGQCYRYLKPRNLGFFANATWRYDHPNESYLENGMWHHNQSRKLHGIGDEIVLLANPLTGKLGPIQQALEKAKSEPVDNRDPIKVRASLLEFD